MSSCGADELPSALSCGLATATSLVLLCVPSQAQQPPSRQSHEIARFLGLSDEQRQTLVKVQLQWAQFEQAQAARASTATTPDALGRLCQESKARQLQVRLDATALLNPGQQAELGKLERVLSLLPVVLSAQAAMLLAPSFTAAVGGLPEGSVEMEHVFMRAPAKPLPGCQVSQRVYPGTQPTGDQRGPINQRP